MTQIILVTLASIITVILEPLWSLIFDSFGGYVPPLFIIFLACLYSWIKEQKAYLILIVSTTILYDVSQGIILGGSGIVSLLAIYIGPLIPPIVVRNSRTIYILGIILTCLIYVLLENTLYRFGLTL
ncbi:hypothetical protein KC571_02005 [candidate division WWE3 bacterium]|uniref:Uncharacterized protein n=1 Tax=candidate division WWE3 bacterium TaxID=2053526 RepID=A0A955LGF6_UNCKA|nr:hypothetical protein [candidate division WWE3 bacterium]